jgi:hypothetical protein
MMDISNLQLRRVAGRDAENYAHLPSLSTDVALGTRFNCDLRLLSWTPSPAIYDRFYYNNRVRQLRNAACVGC